MEMKTTKKKKKKKKKKTNSHLQMFLKILQKVRKTYKKTPVLEFLNKVAALWHACNNVKSNINKESAAQVFFCDFLEMLKSTVICRAPASCCL